MSLVSSATRSVEDTCSGVFQRDFWEGIDWSECFRSRVFHRFVPLTFVALSLSALILRLTFLILVIHFNPSDEEGPRSWFVRFFQDPYAIRPLPSNNERPTSIDDAERITIIHAIEKEEGGHALKLGESVERHDQNEDTASYVSVPDSRKVQQVAGKLVCGFAVLGLLGWSSGGRTMITAWRWTTLLIVAQLVSLLSRRISRSSRQSSIHDFTSTFDYDILCWASISLTISFFDLRTSLLHDPSTPALRDQVIPMATIFVFCFALVLVEGLSPRTSTRTVEHGVGIANSSKSPIPPPLERNASLFSIATFAYLDPLLFEAAIYPSANSPPSATTIPDLQQSAKSARVLWNFRRDIFSFSSPSSTDNQQRHPRHLFWSLVYHVRWDLIKQQCWGWVTVAVFVLPALLLQQILDLIDRRGKGEDIPLHMGLLYVFGIAVFEFIKTISSKQAAFFGPKMQTRLKAILAGEIFTQVLRRSTLSAPPQSTADQSPSTTEEPASGAANDGKIVNLVTVDSARVCDAFSDFHYIWPLATVQVIIGVYFIFQTIGLAAWGSVLVIAGMLVIEFHSFSFVNHLQGKVLAEADTRLTLALEIIHALRLIKYYVWQRKFAEKMEIPRERELKALRSRAILLGAMDMFLYGFPILASTATFLMHTLVLKRPLSPQIAFVTLALINTVRAPLWGFAWPIVPLLQGRTSLKRIEEFLNEPGTEKYSIASPSEDVSRGVGFSDATFTWNQPTDSEADMSTFTLKDLNLQFPEGELSIIVGPVGSGKTCLLLSLLRETHRLSGSSSLPTPFLSNLDSLEMISESVAYCSQIPWLLNNTVRENILFGSPMDEERFQKVIDACALARDVALFPLGVETEVGERGIVVSGGQKARICLARALYSPAKVLLLDDPLSAVDSHTREHLYAKCLKGPLMTGRTCILVTHAVDLCLPGSSYVVFLERGAVTVCGSPENVNPRALESLIQPAQSTTDPIVDDNDTSEGGNSIMDDPTDAFTLIKEEKQAQGSAPLDVYLFYARMLGGWWVVAFMILISTTTQVVEILVSLVLRYWAGSQDLEAPSSVFAARSHGGGFAGWLDISWPALYFLGAVFSLAMFTARATSIPLYGITASRTLYSKMFGNILGAPTRFYDTTPPGQMLNRLSQDIEKIDQDLPRELVFLVIDTMKVLSTLVTICAVIPNFSLLAIAVVFVYSIFGLVYLTTARALNRSESVATSPIIGLLGETTTGAVSIRAYGQTAHFTSQLFSLLDLKSRYNIMREQSSHWLAVRVEIVSTLVGVAVAIFVLLSSIDTALAGFLLTFLIIFNENTIWIVHNWCSYEVRMTNVERLQELAFGFTDLELDQETTRGQSPPAIWPSSDGTIEVENLFVSYAPELPPVLRGVNFQVLPREKIGICGRTGSGKSTLALSFFRFVEATSGRIIIDGLDIATLTLSALRSRLTMIPQDATLFSGTIRFNLDPLDEFDDEEIWDALRRVGMANGEARAAAQSESGRSESHAQITSLDFAVNEGGKNFSLGQRQLLSLARGILKLHHSSILVLDESTASLDNETDAMIQKTIRSEMANATILCIAHRLRTIVDYDKILVLSEGKGVEFGAPWDLLDDASSAFSDLVRSSKEEETELRDMARVARESRALRT